MVKPSLFEQRAFAPETAIIAYLAQRGASAAEENAVPRFVVFLIDLSPRDGAPRSPT
jgi:hypothetical protein